jgi:hypothetical protein
VGIVAVLAVAAVVAAPAHARAATWCGSDPVAQNRLPEAVSGAQFQVVYAYPSDGADRLGATADRIVSDLERISAWWRSHDPAREPRFDLFAFPGCASPWGQVDISSVRLARPASAYAAADATFPLVRTDLVAAGLADVTKKYLVFYDGPLDASNVCGVGSGDPDGGAPSSFAMVWLQATGLCGSVGNGDYGAFVTVHELLHALGAVPGPSGGSGPPHGCPADDGHVCDAINDVLSPRGYADTLSDYVLDVGRDDYYGHGGSWFDVRTSRWLRRLDLPEHPLTVEIAGTADDSVESSLPGIACPPACAIGWEAGTDVELTASAGVDRVFVRWEGACSGEDCAVAMDGPAAVRAVFGPAFFPLTLRVRGRGRIAGDYPCRATCRVDASYDESVRLRAVAARGWRFSGWAGACRGRGACVVRATAARAVTATFVRRR